MKVKGMFREWDIGRHIATFGDYAIWHCNGLMFFRDCDVFEYPDGCQPFVNHMSWFNRWRVYREMNREKRRRSDAAIGIMVKQ
jgi:hypothetical protein